MHINYTNYYPFKTIHFIIICTLGLYRKKYDDGGNKLGSQEALNLLLAHSYQPDNENPAMAHLLSLLTSKAKPPSLSSEQDYYDEPPVNLVYGRRLAQMRPDEPISLMGSTRQLCRKHKGRRSHPIVAGRSENNLGRSRIKIITGEIYFGTVA